MEILIIPSMANAYYLKKKDDKLKK